MRKTDISWFLCIITYAQNKTRTKNELSTNSNNSILILFFFQVRWNSVISDTCAKVHYEKDAQKIQIHSKYAAEILDFCSIHSTVNPYPRQNHSWIKLDMF